MGKYGNNSPRPYNWTRFDQELADLSNSVKRKLERKIDDLRTTQRNLEDELAAVDYDIKDLKKAKSLVKVPSHAMGRMASVEHYIGDLKEAQSLIDLTQDHTSGRSSRSSASVDHYKEYFKESQSSADYTYSSGHFGRTKLFIDNLHYTVKNKDLERHFSKYGQLCDVYIVRSRLTQLSRGYGYVDFYREYSAVDAVNDAANEPHMIEGRYITVRYASEHAAENRALHPRRFRPY